MKISYHYDRRAFFGGREYTVDEGEVTKDNLKKALAAFKRDYSSAVHLDICDGSRYFYACLTWDCPTDYDNGIVNVGTFTAPNAYTDCKRAFDIAKRDAYALIKGVV